MEEIDFELCLGVEKHAAIARRETTLTSSFENVDATTTTTPNLKSPRSHERRNDKHEQEGEGACERETGHECCTQSKKRSKISASGSWREGDQTRPVEGAALDSINSSFSTLFSSSSTDTVDMPATATGRESFNYDEKDEQSAAYSPLSSTFKNLHIHEPGTHPSNDSDFVIYEDPEGRVIRDYGFYLPEDWYSYPEDNKENTDELDDQDEEASTEEFESFEGGEEMNHQRHRRQQFDHNPLGARAYYYHDVRSNRPNFSIDNYTGTGGGEARHHTERTMRHRNIGTRLIPFDEGRMEDASSLREARGTESMSLFGVPPRRFLGRGRA